MKRSIIFLTILALSLVVIIPITVSALPLQLNYRAVETPLLSYIDLLVINPIPLGSQIDNVSFSVNMVGKPVNEQCQLMLIDDVLNHDPISEKFTCNGTNTIPLTQKGVDALENNLSIESFKIGVNYPNTSLTTFSVNFADVNYHAPQTFAKIENGIVTNVIVAEQSFVDNQLGEWVQTTNDNVNGKFAGIGDTFDSVKNKFISPQPYPSWILDGNDNWNSPTPYPTDGLPYKWNESTLGWYVT